jgi:hypothetical protein
MYRVVLVCSQVQDVGFLKPLCAQRSNMEQITVAGSLPTVLVTY